MARLPLIFCLLAAALLAACGPRIQETGRTEPPPTTTDNGPRIDRAPLFPLLDGDGDGSPFWQDCDDGDPRRAPTRPESCDGVDNDCDRMVDEPSAEVCDGVDNDCDGVRDEDFDLDGDGVATCAGDCDDADASVPAAGYDYCDGIDSNCDGIPEVDADGDGSLSCRDCDDADAAVHHGVTDDACDGIDLDCRNDETDDDGDGSMPCGGDCDDSDAATHPGAVETCDSADDDCNGLVDDTGVDADGDGANNCEDCDETDPTVFPGANEVCDGLVNDCSVSPPDRDADGDGYGPCEGDCIEAGWGASDINPGAIELCNGVDDDCDGVPDEGWDMDWDGLTACGPDGVSGTVDDDCRDDDPSVPGPELCDGVDQDCDSIADEDFDLDGDGVATCGGDGVHGTADDDCDDLDPDRRPGLVDLPDGFDADCDGLDFVPAPTPPIPSPEELRDWFLAVVDFVSKDRTGSVRPSGCTATSRDGSPPPTWLAHYVVPGLGVTSWSTCAGGGGAKDVDYTASWTGPGMSGLPSCGQFAVAGSWIETAWIAQAGARWSGHTWWIWDDMDYSWGCASNCDYTSWSTGYHGGGGLTVVREPGAPGGDPATPEGTSQFTWTWSDTLSVPLTGCNEITAEVLTLNAASHATTTPWTAVGELHSSTTEVWSWGYTTGCALEPSSGSITAEVLDAPGGQPLRTIELTFGGACDGCIDWSVDGVPQTPWCTSALEM